MRIQENANKIPMGELIENQVSLKTISYMKDILSSLSLVVFVINEKRQVVFANGQMLSKIGVSEAELLNGKRPGELLRCINSEKDPGGCGASESCKYCGILDTIVLSQKYNRKETSEAVLVLHNGYFQEQVDLEVTATPLEQPDGTYTIVSFVDISEKRRRQYMERIFFHDIINIAGSLRGVLDLIEGQELNEQKEFLKIASGLSEQIVDEIKNQRDMQMAEEGDLVVQEKTFLLREYLLSLSVHIQYHAVAVGKNICLAPRQMNVELNTDKALLGRVLVNMLKNALEETQKGGLVKYGWDFAGKNKIRIWVRNDGMMSDSVKAQVFHRSFSTKGKGRGLGTYSMKLLGERYLRGKVDFTSDESGTLFFIELPYERELSE